MKSVLRKKEKERFKGNSLESRQDTEDLPLHFKQSNLVGG